MNDLADKNRVLYDVRNKKTILSQLSTKKVRGILSVQVFNVEGVEWQDDSKIILKIEPMEHVLDGENNSIQKLEVTEQPDNSVDINMLNANSTLNFSLHNIFESKEEDEGLETSFELGTVADGTVFKSKLEFPNNSDISIQVKIIYNPIQNALDDVQREIGEIEAEIYKIKEDFKNKQLQKSKSEKKEEIQIASVEEEDEEELQIVSKKPSNTSQRSGRGGRGGTNDSNKTDRGDTLSKSGAQSLIKKWAVKALQTILVGGHYALEFRFVALFIAGVSLIHFKGDAFRF